MKRFGWIFVILVLGCAMAAGLPSRQEGRPKLVVVLVVDQMRADYLDRFESQLESGLERVTSSGLQYKNAFHDHAFTNTAPGHATLMTGVHPGRNGIVDNNWVDRVTQRRVYGVEDTTVAILGFPRDSGRSPANLFRETVTDWLKTQSAKGKVYSIAIKDRVAVLMGGHRPDGAFWYHTGTGRYVTSTYYDDSYPGWLDAFNEERKPIPFILEGWHKLRPEEAYSLSREDDFADEDDSVDAAFPHLFDVVWPDTTLYPDSIPQPEPWQYARFRRMPFGDMLTFGLAREIVTNEALGTDDAPDLLMIGASAADYVGHDYGPYSQEVQDYYLRLDIMLAEFLGFLDERVGREDYVLILTADHGVGMMPEEAARRGEDATRIGTRTFRDAVTTGLGRAIQKYQIYSSPQLSFLYPYGLNVSFSDDVPGDSVTEEEMVGIREILAEEIRKVGAIEDVITYEELLDPNTPSRPFLDLYRHSFHPDRAADIILRFKRFGVPNNPPANHGSPYEYDQRVPLIFVGPGIEPQSVKRAVRSVDLAPTLAAILGIVPPDDLDGVVLEEAVGGRQ
jgi:predicted AlkP superfamily pyrophosphatase or phosphodiesterase